jgi:hypothetical protein
MVRLPVLVYLESQPKLEVGAQLHSIARLPEFILYIYTITQADLVAHVYPLEKTALKTIT